MRSLAFLLMMGVAFAAPPTYKIVNRIKIGGASRWDYSYVDTANHRLYVSHGTQTEVIDTSAGTKVGTLAGTNGVHGIAVANDLNRGFTSDGADNKITIFDLKTLQVLGTAPTGQNPDSIIYDTASHRVFTFNGRSNDATAIDARTGAVIASSIPVGGKPEFSQIDGKGRVWVNIETTNEIVEIDTRKAAVTKRYSIAPCEEPTGLARDPQTGILYSGCSNKLMVVSDPAAGKVLATVPIGGGCDGVVRDDGYLFSANGADGTVTMAGETSPGTYEAVATIPTLRSARTISVDPGAHRLYLPAAEPGPAVQGKGGKQGRPQLLPDSFEVLVLGR